MVSKRSSSNYKPNIIIHAFLYQNIAKCFVHRDKSFMGNNYLKAICLNLLRLKYYVIMYLAALSKYFVIVMIIDFN